MTDLYLLAVNLTRRCNLACAHCYMDAGARAAGTPDELSTREVEALLDQVAERSTDTMVVLTGGEPLLRRDLEDLLAHGNGLGLSMVVGTNGVLLDEARAASLKQAGALGIGISLDSLDPTLHDDFRGCPGSWEKTLTGMEACRRLKLPFQVHFSVTEANAGEISSMIEFARSAGAHVLNVFFLICTGRGESMSDITPATYERVLEQLVEAQEHPDGLIVRARCAPHFKRIAYQRDPLSPLTLAQGYEGGAAWRVSTTAVSHRRAQSPPAPISPMKKAASERSPSGLSGTLPRPLAACVTRNSAASAATASSASSAVVAAPVLWRLVRD